MCAPADYDALGICFLRVVELSTAGLTAYAIHRTIKLFGELRRERPERPETPSTLEVPGILVEVKRGGSSPR